MAISDFTKRFFEPTPELRIRDVLREVRSTIGGFLSTGIQTAEEIQEERRQTLLPSVIRSVRREQAKKSRSNTSWGRRD